MAKKMRKSAVLCMALALCLSVMTVPAFASNGEGNTGTGQTQVHIHLEGTIGSNKDEVTIIVGDNQYNGVRHDHAPQRLQSAHEL